MNYLIQHIASASDPSPTYFHIHFSEHNYSGCRKLFACVSRWRNISKSPTASLCLFLCFSMLFLFSSSLPLGCNKTLPRNQHPSSFCPSPHVLIHLLVLLSSLHKLCLGWIKMLHFQQHWNRHCVSQAFEKTRWVGTQTFPRLCD